MSGFLPITKKEMRERGITQFDFVYVIGDAYVDHPSFGHAIISRLLESHGYSVGIISQPDWKNDESIADLRGAEARLPRVGGKYGFDGESLFRLEKAAADRCLYAGRRHGKTAGSGADGLQQSDPSGSTRRRRSSSAASKRACGVWLITITGRNSLKRSVLLDSGADIISYGMGETSHSWRSPRLWTRESRSPISTFHCRARSIRPSTWKTSMITSFCPPLRSSRQTRPTYAKSFYVQYCNTDPIHRKTAGGALSEQRSMWYRIRRQSP